MKVKECSKCGCDREILIRAEVMEQTKDTQLSGKTTWLCVTCLLGSLGQPFNELTKLTAYKRWMKCVEDGK